ncbi:Methyltransferase 11 [Pandoravirus macleodensis]|uniref:Methyltransferase 11 n=1 Tax=Pandoravirus macleodensis TaxID=2107707 RepID=A0A2U7UFX3_9VIRU|nr:Methyltransferase 11 [Pandoravirus macleodensis]AVK77364.1 Methyltransferase 11 [Pandoravirus macleodensis]
MTTNNKSNAIDDRTLLSVPTAMDQTRGGNPKAGLATDAKSMYKDNMAALPAFVGPFINFGYWPHQVGRTRPPTLADREASGMALYERVFEALDPRGAVVEVGCGLAAGCRAIADRYSAQVVTSITGIDASSQQLARAAGLSTTNACDGRVHLAEALAERLPFADASTDRIYTVEALQHFGSPSDFVAEAARCLAPGGRLVVCTFLASRTLAPSEHDTIASRIRTVAVGVDKLVEVGALCDAMTGAGLVVTTPQPVGDRVWEAFCAWCAVAQPSWTWPAAWLDAYRAGWVDYYLLVADKPL